MNDQTQAAADLKAREEQAAAALAGIMTNTIRQVSGQTEALQTAIFALSAILVVTPSTAQLSEERLAVVIQVLLGQQQSDEPMRRVVNYVSHIVTMAKKMNAVIADLEEKGLLAAAPVVPAGDNKSATKSKSTTN
jgi:hypothetical protein